MAEEINELMEILISNAVDKENFYAMRGTATNINETTRTCDFTPIDGQAKRSGIRLQSILSSTVGLLLVPENNSIVVVTFFDRLKGFVSLTTKLDKILIDTALTQFNGGSNDGLININDLVTSINVVEAKLDSFIALYNTHIHITTATVGAGPTPGIISPTTSTETPHGQTSAKGDWEDIKVLH